RVDERHAAIDAIQVPSGPARHGVVLEERHDDVVAAHELQRIAFAEQRKRERQRLRVADRGTGHRVAARGRARIEGSALRADAEANLVHFVDGHVEAHRAALATLDAVTSPRPERGLAALRTIHVGEVREQLDGAAPGRIRGVSAGAGYGDPRAAADEAAVAG